MEVFIPAIFVFIISVLLLSGVWAVASLGLNLQWGYTGLFNIGVGAFIAVGAYTAAILTTPPLAPTINVPGHLGGFSQPFWVGLIGAILMTGLVAFLIALPTLRLRADYLAIATIGLAEIIRRYLQNAESITGGTFAIGSIPRPGQDIGLDIGPILSDLIFFAIVIAAIVVVYLLLERSVRSPWGRVLVSIREDEDASQALGKNTFRYKLQAFVLGAMIMGAAGALFAHLFRVIESGTTFVPADTFLIWIMVIVGGSANNKGVILGAFLIQGIFSFSRLFTAPLSNLGGIGESISDNFAFIRILSVGIILILLMMYRPQGILGEERVISKVT